MEAPVLRVMAGDAGKIRKMMNDGRAFERQLFFLNLHAAFADADRHAFWLGFFSINVEAEPHDDHRQSPDNEIKTVASSHTQIPR